MVLNFFNLLLKRYRKSIENNFWKCVGTLFQRNDFFSLLFVPALDTACALAKAIAHFPQLCMNADRKSAFNSAFSSASLQVSLRRSFFAAPASHLQHDLTIRIASQRFCCFLWENCQRCRRRLCCFSALKLIKRASVVFSRNTFELW